VSWKSSAPFRVLLPQVKVHMISIRGACELTRWAAVRQRRPLDPRTPSCPSRSTIALAPLMRDLLWHRTLHERPESRDRDRFCWFSVSACGPPGSGPGGHLQGGGALQPRVQGSNIAEWHRRLFDPNPNTRLEAVDSLLKDGSEEAVKPLMDATADADPRSVPRRSTPWARSGALSRPSCLRSTWCSAVRSRGPSSVCS